MKKNVYLTISIEDAFIKVLQVKMQRGFLSVVSCDVEFIAPGSLEDQQIAALQKIVSEGDIVKEGAIIIVPRKQVVLKQLTLPSQTETEIKRMIDLQLASQIPYAKEDAIFDFSIIHKDSSGYTKVLVASVHKDVVEKYSRMVHAAGLSIQKVALSSFGIMNWFANQKKIRYQGSGKALVLIDIDFHVSEICFFEEDRLVYSRNINFGSQDLKKKEMGLFMDQLGLTFGVYKKESLGPDIGQMIVLSGIKEAEFLKEQLIKFYNLPVDVFDSQEAIVCEKGLDISRLKTKEGSSIIANIGSVFFEGYRHVDFTPKETLAVKKRRIKKREIFKFVLAFVVAGLCCGAALNIRNYQKRAYLRDLKNKLEQTAAEVKKAEMKMQLVDFVRDKVQGHILIAEVIHELYQLTPEDIAFRSLNISRQDMIAIQGFSDSSSSVDKFQGQLVKSKMFNNVNLQYATNRKRYRKEYVDFKIVCRLASDKEQDF